MTTSFNKLRKRGLLLHEVRPVKEHAPRAALRRVRRALEPIARRVWVATNRPESVLDEDLLHPLERARVLGMVVCEVKRLINAFALRIEPPSVTHLHTSLCSPAQLRKLRHVTRRERVARPLLVAWGVVEYEEPRALPSGLALEDVNGAVNLFEDIVGGKVAVAVLAGFPEPASLSGGC